MNESQRLGAIAERRLEIVSVFRLRSDALLGVFAGQPELGLGDFENYRRLSPRDRLPTYLNGIGEAYFFSRRFDEAAASLLASLDLAPNFPVTYRVLASCYAHLGRLDEAREIVRRLRASTPAVMETVASEWRPVR